MADTEVRIESLTLDLEMAEEKVLIFSIRIIKFSIQLFLLSLKQLQQKIQH